MFLHSSIDYFAVVLVHKNPARWVSWPSKQRPHELMAKCTAGFHLWILALGTHLTNDLCIRESLQFKSGKNPCYSYVEDIDEIKSEYTCDGSWTELKSPVNILLVEKVIQAKDTKKISLLFLCEGYYQHILSLALVCVRHNGGRRKQNENTNTVWLNQQYMMTSSNGNIFRVTDPLCGEFTGLRWIPRTKASDAELWCFLWSAPNSTAE